MARFVHPQTGQLIVDGVPQLTAENFYRPRASSINRSNRSAASAQAQVAADGDTIPIIYGHQRIGAQVLTWVEYGGQLIAHCQWGVGGKYGLSGITVQINDEAVPAQVSVQSQAGTTSQPPQPVMVAAVDGFADNLVADVPVSPGVTEPMGICNSVVSVPPRAVEGVPVITAVLDGLPCFDPRIGSDINDQGNWSFTKNPSLILADFISSKLYGWGRKIDWDSVATCADANDEVVGGQPRREIGFSILTRQSCESIVNLLKTYAGVFVNFVGDTIVLVPDRPASVTRALDNNDFLANSMRLRKGRQADAPTVIEVEYTDTTVTPWDTKRAQAKTSGVDLGTAPWKLSVVSMPGIQAHEQAMREAIERINRLTVIDLTGQHTISAEGLQDLAGDVLEVTNSIGLTNKNVRLLSCVPAGSHLWNQTWEEYDAGIYSDEVIGAPASPDTALPNPLEIPLMDEIELVERPYTDENGRTYSTIRVTWDGVSWPFVNSYRVRVQGVNVDQEGFVTHSGAGNPHTFVSHNVKQGVLYTVRVAIVGALAVGEPASATITLQGKLLNPSNVPSLSGFEAGQYVWLTWGQAVDEDLTGYQIRRAPSGSTDPWNARTIISRSYRGDSILIPNQPEGKQIYSIRAHDSRYDLSDGWDFTVGFSPNETTAEIDVTVFRGGSQQSIDIDHTQVSLTNFQFAFVSGQPVLAAPEFGDTWGANVAWNTEPDHWILPYSDATPTSLIASDEFDAGSDLKGYFAWTARVESFSISGSLNVWEEYLDTATQSAYPTFTANAGRTQETTARYARMRIVESDAVTDNNSGVAIQFPITLSVSQETRTEQGVVAVTNSAVVAFANPFSVAPVITVSAQSSTAVTVTYDQVTSTQFTIYVFVGASPGSATVTWTATG